MADKVKAGELVMVFSAEDGLFHPVAKKVEQSMKDVAGSAKESGKEVEGFIVNVRQFTILYQFAAGMKAMGDAAEKVATEMRLGKASTGDLIEKIAEGIPIIGRFVEAGRAIREAITGEKAYTEVLKQQTEQQEKRIELMERIAAATRKVTRETEDLQQRLNRHPGDSDFFASISDTFLKGSRAADDIQERIKKESKLLGDVTAARTAAGQKLQDAILNNREFIAPSGPGGTGTFVPRQFDSQDVTNARNEIKKLDQQATEYRGTLAKLQAALTETAQRGFYTDLGKIFGKEVGKGLKEGQDAIDTYIARLPKLTATTRTMLEEAGGAWLKYRSQIGDLGLDLAKNLIDQGQFDKLAGASFWEQASKPLADYVNNVKAATETNLRFFDSWLGAPGARLANTVKGLVKTTADLFGGKPKKPEDFRAQFVSLAGLGNRIQQGAGSLSAEELAAKALEEQKKTAKNTEATAKYVEKIASRSLVSVAVVQ